MRVSKASLSALALSALALTAAMPAAVAQDTSAQETKAEVDELEAENVREEVDAMSEAALDRLLSSNEKIEAQFEESVGYAVFRATKGGFFVTGAGGTGVAVHKDSDERTYMHMGSGGIGLGAGLQNYHPIFLFATEAAMDKFVAGGWDASSAAQAAAGKQGANVTSSFVDGVAVYQLTDKGLIAQADVSGTRFWQSEKLNAVTEN